MAREHSLLGPLAVRMALAFIAVAMGALAVLGVLVLVVAARDVTNLARNEQDHAVVSIADATAAAYAEAGGWAGADLRAARAVAAESGAGVIVLDATRTPVDPTPARLPTGRVRSAGVTIGGQAVGTVRVGFPDTGLPSAERHLRDALVRAVAVGAGVAALLALAAAIFVARRIAHPVFALTRAARAVEAGDRSARVGDIAAPGELGELAVAFDRMAAAVDREEGLRRELVVDVAHELRTPLTILRASLEGMTDGVIEATPAALSSAHDDVLRLARTVEDLEALARADSSGLRLEVRPVDLSAVVSEAVAPLEAHFQAAGIELITRLAPASVSGDPHRLRQVATNLLTNALKFTPAGGRVSVETLEDGVEARLTVANTGPGIAPEDVPRVFERFWRGANASAVAGSGIGLPVVAELVAAHEGRVSVGPGPSGGTVAEVTLPSVQENGLGVTRSSGAPDR
jgi:two-component system, OmpR family, sensor histidine kinase BaeS